VSPAAVCFDEALAAMLSAGGVDVVLCRPDPAVPPRALRPAGGGRIAVFVGDPALVEEAAMTMARELFGGQPAVVRSPADAAQLIPGVPGSRDSSSGTVDIHP
jgi:hypothetical protein